MEKSNAVHKKTARLETLSKLYDIPIWSLRKMASRRAFPGIIQRPGERRLYIDVERFDRWFRAGATEEAGE